MLAKICSDLNKPNGQYELLNETEAKEFVAKLSCRKIGGIGNVTEQLLGNLLFTFSNEIVYFENKEMYVYFRSHWC